jgi:2-oxoglutarate dehydrogenase E1 component
MSLKSISQISYLSSGEEYIEHLYELYLENPNNVEPSWKNYFDSINASEKSPDISHEAFRQFFLNFKSTNTQDSNSSVEHEKKQALVKEMVYAYRELGHLNTNLDPLELTLKPLVPELDPKFYGFNLQEEGETTFIPDHFADGKPRTLSKLVSELNQVYCGHIGSEYLHIMNQDEVHWIQHRLENPPSSEDDTKTQERILACLTAAEGLEKYLGTKYTGQKRFSLEGGDSLIPLLDTLIQDASCSHDVKEIVIGMAHRGRLNVLVNILGKSPQELFDAFEGKIKNNQHSGDVKYHLGFSSDVKTHTGSIHLALAFNPSHLEIVSPVVMGSVRSRQQHKSLEKKSEVLGIQIHGDAAFAGQGVVMETFALSQTHGHNTAGSIHIVINNQVGFTTDPTDARSTYYCTEIAKMIQAPIFHVNGDDPIAVLFATKIALDYRMAFRKDVVIDLVCYRRHGHNEADEPSATQPVMYRKIKSHPTTREIYANKLIELNKITSEKAQNMVEDYRDALDKAQNLLISLDKQHSNSHVNWASHIDKPLDEQVKPINDIELLQRLGTQINTLPNGMVLQPQVAKIIDDNRKMAKGEIPLNWGFAENLSYATLLHQKFGVRISGQDSGRGTFAHRHAVLHDYASGKLFTPLNQLSDNFSIIDSILSEEAVLAFEYGYSTSTPDSLVIWEAQFGDFANGAQVVIDQFISSGEQKWDRLSGIVLLLPHGYEGMGPEHSSARLERFLQLCAQENMQVCVPTTPAQIFHLLRRQLIRKARKPLIVMTPKSLLRHKLAVSNLEELNDGQFQPVIPESEKISSTLKRIIFCSGKIYYDLIEYRKVNNIADTALLRIEELYPFPQKQVKQFIQKSYADVNTVVWCQEEPQNQGAWTYVKSEIEACLKSSQQLVYAGRKPAAATAVGTAKLHVIEQQQSVAEAFKL